MEKKGERGRGKEKGKNIKEGMAGGRVDDERRLCSFRLTSASLKWNHLLVY